MSAAIFELRSTQAFMREGYAGRWEGAARMVGMTVDAAQRQHLALRMAAAVLGTSDGVTPEPKVVLLPATGPKSRVAAACQEAGITLDEARSPSRLGPLVARRQHVMWLLHAGGMSSPEIGRRLERDHTTVLHGIKKHDERLQLNARL